MAGGLNLTTKITEFTLGELVAWVDIIEGGGGGTTPGSFTTLDASAATTLATTLSVSGLSSLSSIGVGATPSLAIGLNIAPGLSGAASEYGVKNSATFDASSTTAGYGVFVSATTAAAAFTQVNQYGVYIASPTKGAGSTITNRYGLYVEAVTGGGTLNYGAYFAGGTPAIYVAAGGVEVLVGGIGVGIAPSASIGFYTGNAPFTGTAQWGASAAFTSGSDATSSVRGFVAGITTAAASFTCANRMGFYHQNVAKGAASTITNDYGVYVEAPTQGGTINYGVYIAGGAPALFIAGGGFTVTGNSTITGTLGGLTGLTVASGGAAISGNSTIVGTLGSVTTLTAVTGTFTGAITSNSPSLGIGYATGAGIALTQGTNRTTAVVGNGLSGTITLFSAAGSTTPASFTMTNTSIAALDIVHITQKTGTDKYEIFVTATAAGSCVITSFTTGGTTTEAPVFNFIVFKSVAA